MAASDSPWKEALDRFLPAFLAFFFPDVHRGIDWSRGYEALDKELQQIAQDAELGTRLADKLYKVWRKDGTETWMLIHVEVQSQADETLSERMFVYYYRIYDRYRRPVVSLVVLGDDRPGWRPQEYRQSLWGCSVTLQFPVVKLLDYAGRQTQLETDASVFAPIVLAHLKTLETRGRPEDRRTWKVRLVKGLFDRGLTRDEVRQLFRLIDWMMSLPKELEMAFAEEIHRFEEEKKMPYVTSIERLALEEGEKRGKIEVLMRNIEKGLNHRFGAEGLALLPQVRAIQEVDKLEAILDRLWTASSLEEIRSLVS